MTQTSRYKVVLDSCETREIATGKDQVTGIFSFQVPGTDETKKQGLATPPNNGSLWMTVDKMPWKIGQAFYLDLTTI